MPDELAAAQNLDDGEAGLGGPQVLDPDGKSTYSIAC